MSFKVVLVGASGVGKTSLLFAMKYGEFAQDQTSTIGSNFENIKVKTEDKEYLIRLWDTAGQEQYESITKSYFNGANAIFLVFSLINQESFECLPRWLKHINEAAPEHSPVILLGNKLDVEDKERIPEAVINQFVAENKQISVYLETSAADGTNVSEALYTCIEEILKGPDIEKKEPESLQKLQPGQGTGSCC